MKVEELPLINWCYVFALTRRKAIQQAGSRLSEEEYKKLDQPFYSWEKLPKYERYAIDKPHALQRAVVSFEEDRSKIAEAEKIICDLIGRGIIHG